MTKLIEKRRPKLPKAYIACSSVCLIAGAFLMNQVDRFTQSHLFSFRSPVLIQSPVLITERILSPIQIIKKVEASAEAVPAAEETASPSTASTVAPATPKKSHLFP